MQASLIKIASQRCAFTAIRSFSTPKINMSLIKVLREKTGAPMNDCKEALVTSSEASLSDDQILEKAVEFLRKKGSATASKKAGRSATEGLVGLSCSADSKVASLVEVNSETDFASRSSQFQELVSQIAQTSLSQGQSSNAEISIDSLKESKLGQKTVSAAVLDAVTAIRENLQLRRAARVSVPNNGVVGFYMHNAVEVSESITASACAKATKLGRIGAIVALESKDNASEQLQDLANKLAMHVVAAQPLYKSKQDVPASVIEKEQQIITEQALQQGKNKDTIQKMLQGRLNKFYEDVVLLEQKYMITDDAKPPKISQLLQQHEKQLGTSLTLTQFVRFAVGEGLAKQEKQSFADEVQEKLQSK